MNKIIEITECFGVSKKTNEHLSELDSWVSLDGYKIKTEQDEIYLLIDNGQCCCETWGYFSTDDDLQKFIGAELIGIQLTDTSLKTETIEEIKYLDEGDVQFVTFKTDNGVFQLAVYNSHNGYYGHRIYLFKNNDCLLKATL